VFYSFENNFNFPVLHTYTIFSIHINSVATTICNFKADYGIDVNATNEKERGWLGEGDKHNDVCCAD
jgi:hypothetical protein